MTEAQQDTSVVTSKERLDAARDIDAKVVTIEETIARLSGKLKAAKADRDDCIEQMRAVIREESPLFEATEEPEDEEAA